MLSVVCWNTFTIHGNEQGFRATHCVSILLPTQDLNHYIRLLLRRSCSPTLPRTGKLALCQGIEPCVSLYFRATGGSQPEFHTRNHKSLMPQVGLKPTPPEFSLHVVNTFKGVFSLDY